MKPYYEEDGITIYHGDCREVLPLLPAAALIFFDPPYGLGIAAWDSAFDAKGHADLCWANICDGGSIYATCSPHILAGMLGLFSHRRLIAWGKPNLPLRKNLNEWEWSTEYVVWATKGEPRVFNKPTGENARDYWRIAVESGFLNRDAGQHPARKPIELLLRIVGASTRDGDLVVDPFCGSGTTLKAAKQSGRRAIGIEIEERYCEIAAKRLSQRVLPLTAA
jgi:site-specific DNA-methyltransferase (adenine-specific)